VLTYPRTSSKCLPQDYREIVANTLTAFAENRRRDDGFADLAAAAQRLRDNGLENEARIFDDAGVTDHFAIVPTGALPRETLTGDDKRLFDLVARRFFGAFHPPAQWERVERTTAVGDDHFRTRARTLVVPGWRSVLADTSDGEEETALPALVPGAEESSGVAVRALEAKSEAEETKPPARITEARLLSLMENAGPADRRRGLLGGPAREGHRHARDARRHHREPDRQGLRGADRQGAAPDVKGIRMIDTLRRVHIDRLTSPELTGEIEYHLLQVERGSRTRSDFMGEITDYTGRDRRPRQELRLRRALRRERDVRQLPELRAPRDRDGVVLPLQREPPRDPDCPLRFWKDISGRYLDKRTVRALIADGTSGEIDGFTHAAAAPIAARSRSTPRTGRSR
jgi:DNA topoisomerase-3